MIQLILKQFGHFTFDTLGPRFNIEELGPVNVVTFSQNSVICNPVNIERGLDNVNQHRACVRNLKRGFLDDGDMIVNRSATRMFRTTNKQKPTTYCYVY